jgi:hypothetical protein
MVRTCGIESDTVQASWPFPTHAMFKSAFISRPRQMCGEADTGTCFAVEQLMIGLSPRRCPGHKGRGAGSGWPHIQGID